jgi:hypothetical protein
MSSPQKHDKFQQVVACFRMLQLSVFFPNIKAASNRHEAMCLVLTLFTDRAMAQAVSRRPLIAKPRVCGRFSPCMMYGGQSGTGTDFSPSSSVFPCQYHSTVAPQSHSPLGDEK